MLRRHLWRWVTVAMLATLASSAVGTTTASADVINCSQTVAHTGRSIVCPRSEYRTAGVKHTGWVYLNLNYCPAGALCRMMFRDSVAAWSWGGSAWKPATLRGGWVYVYPYTGNWRWAWTQQSGWVAISGSRFEIRPY